MRERRRRSDIGPSPGLESTGWQDQLALADAIAGVAGPGRWLVAAYRPVSLFSLKVSLATSSVGKTLVVPTVYAIKMAFVDAAFRAGLPDEACASLLRGLVAVDVRIAPPEVAIVTHTFVKVRQEPKQADVLRPYVSSIAYREVVSHHGTWQWAIDLGGGDATLAEHLVLLAPHVNMIGKRGSFIQFAGLSRREALSGAFTQPAEGNEWTMPSEFHVAMLDDFGPEADLATLSSYGSGKPKRDRHRKFVQTIIPLGIVSTGPGFTEYAVGTSQMRADW